jgi:hypothetical protein
VFLLQQAKSSAVSPGRPGYMIVTGSTSTDTLGQRTSP